MRRMPPLAGETMPPAPRRPLPQGCPNTMTPTPTPPSSLRQLPAGIWVLGLVSLLMDVSSEMIHSLLPLFMVTTLGTSVLAVGLIEGLAESTALIVKVFSGALSDYLGRRKGLALLGYGLGALSKPLFALAPGIGLLVTARLIDRVGKGIRGAPRDALVADIAPAQLRGAAFGLRQSLDTVGAFLGPLLGVGLPNRQIEVSALYYTYKLRQLPPEQQHDLAGIDLRFDTLMADLDLPVRSAHNALNDAVMAALAFVKLRKLLAD